jgi:hypothetical protein
VPTISGSGQAIGVTDGAFPFAAAFSPFSLLELE